MLIPFSNRRHCHTYIKNVSFIRVWKCWKYYTFFGGFSSYVKKGNYPKWCFVACFYVVMYCVYRGSVQPVPLRSKHGLSGESIGRRHLSLQAGFLPQTGHNHRMRTTMYARRGVQHDSKLCRRTVRQHLRRRHLRYQRTVWTTQPKSNLQVSDWLLWWSLHSLYFAEQRQQFRRFRRWDLQHETEETNKIFY